MRNASIILKALAILGAIVLAGLLIGWLATRGTQKPPANPPVVQTPPAPPAPPRSSDPERVIPTPGPLVPQPGPAPVTQPVLTQAAPIVPPGTNNWEDRLDEILASETIDDTNKVKQLFAMFPTLPPDGQEEVAQHLSNLVEDEDYAPLGRLLVENPKLSEDVQDTLMSDLLNRPNAVKLPLFLELARNPEHPQAEEARDLLELYLDEEFGTDWNKWRVAIQDWLKENPD